MLQHRFAQEHKQKMEKVMCDFIELINYVTTYNIALSFIHNDRA